MHSAVGFHIPVLLFQFIYMPSCPEPCESTKSMNCILAMLSSSAYKFIVCCVANFPLELLHIQEVLLFSKFKKYIFGILGYKKCIFCIIKMNMFGDALTNMSTKLKKTVANTYLNVWLQSEPACRSNHTTQTHQTTDAHMQRFCLQNKIKYFLWIHQSIQKIFYWIMRTEALMAAALWAH